MKDENATATKDENGALVVRVSRQTPNEDIMLQSNVDYERKVKDDLADLVGMEVIKNFPVHKETPLWLNGTVYHTEVVVMSAADYKKLAEDAWKYKDLQS